MITPIRKPPHRELLDWEKEFNTAINKIRWKIEQTIANLKTWRILHTDYRRPLATFADTISAVIGLQFYRTARITLTVLVLPNTIGSGLHLGTVRCGLSRLFDLDRETQVVGLARSRSKSRFEPATARL